jgi:hypothetical protein
MLLEDLERDDIQRALVCRSQHHERGRSVNVSAEPVRSRDTPAIAGHQARELELWHRGREVVADTALVLEEISGDDRANRVAAEILRTGVATPVAVEPRHGVAAAHLQRPPEHIAVSHTAVSISRNGNQAWAPGSTQPTTAAYCAAAAAITSAWKIS